MSSEHKHSFPPVEDGQLEILILGSLPGDRSIAAGEYYAHPHNRFWPLMAKLLKQELPTDYAQRKEMLLAAHIGLWDVAHSAKRKGSADVDIMDAVPNDIVSLIGRNRQLHTIGFNGKKAEQLFRRHISLPDDSIRTICLPSTSPAYATIDLDRLYEVWRSTICLDK